VFFAPFVAKRLRALGGLRLGSLAGQRLHHRRDDLGRCRAPPRSGRLHPLVADEALDGSQDSVVGGALSKVRQ
jgi:hypothetical protein